MSNYLTIIEACNKMNYSPGYISKLCKNKTLDAKKEKLHGSKKPIWLISEDSINNFINEEKKVKDITFYKGQTEIVNVPIPSQIIERFNKETELMKNKTAVARTMLKKYSMNLSCSVSTILRDFYSGKTSEKRLKVYSMFFENDVRYNVDTLLSEIVDEEHLPDKESVDDRLCEVTYEDIFKFVDNLDRDKLIYLNMLLTNVPLYNHERRKYEGTTKSR